MPAIGWRLDGPVSSPTSTRPGARARDTGLDDARGIARVDASSSAKIAALAAAGLANKQIAAQLVLSVRTVDVHLQSTYTKLGISGRRDLREALARLIAR